MARLTTVDEIAEASRALPEQEALALLARLEGELRREHVEGRRTAPPPIRVWLLRGDGPAPTDEEVEGILFEERLKRYLR